MVDPPGDVTGWDAMVGVNVNSAALFLDCPFNTVQCTSITQSYPIPFDQFSPGSELGWVTLLSCRPATSTYNQIDNVVWLSNLETFTFRFDE